MHSISALVVVSDVSIGACTALLQDLCLPCVWAGCVAAASQLAKTARSRWVWLCHLQRSALPAGPALRRACCWRCACQRAMTLPELAASWQALQGLAVSAAAQTLRGAQLAYACMLTPDHVVVAAGSCVVLCEVFFSWNALHRRGQTMIAN